MYQVYKVLSDDTFSSIADRFCVDSSELERINGFSDFSVGDMIVVPNNSMYITYIVKKGDSLYSIAKSFDQDVNVLYSINGIKEGDYIYPDEKLLIPRRGVFTYMTIDGDTINSVSGKSSIPINELISSNDFILEPGQLIIYNKNVQVLFFIKYFFFIFVCIIIFVVVSRGEFMKKILCILMILFVFLISGCGSKQLTTYHEISYQDYLSMIDNEESFPLVIGSATCSACAMFKGTMETFINKYQVDVRYIDISKLSEEDYSALMTDVNFNSTPTTIFIENGKQKSVYQRIVGAESYSNVVSNYKKQGYIGDQYEAFHY